MECFLRQTHLVDENAQALASPPLRAAVVDQHQLDFGRMSRTAWVYRIRVALMILLRLGGRIRLVWGTAVECDWGFVVRDSHGGGIPVAGRHTRVALLATHFSASARDIIPCSRYSCSSFILARSAFSSEAENIHI